MFRKTKDGAEVLDRSNSRLGQVLDRSNSWLTWVLDRSSSSPAAVLDQVDHLAFGDIWCLFVSFGPAPHIYQRGERVGEPVCTIHGHYPESTWSSVRLASEVPGNMPHPVCLHIDPAARPVPHEEVHMARAVGAN